MKIEHLKAGMIIRLIPGYYTVPWGSAKIKILNDYDDIYWEDDDGSELEEPWECELMEDIKDNEGNIVCSKGNTEMFYIAEKYKGNPAFMLCYTKTNKPGWF